METLLIPLAFLIGGLLVVQAAANVQLTAAARSAAAAAAGQLAVAAALLAALVTILDRRYEIGGPADLVPWHLSGGIGSALYILAGIVLFRRLGAVVSVGLFITGQMLASLALDGFGLLGVARDPVSATTAAGALALVAGMGLIARTARTPAGQPVPDRRPPASAQPALIGFGLVAGAALPVQAAVNAQLRADLDAPFTAALISFLVATATMLAVAAAAVATGRDRVPRLAGLPAMPWWGWLGGLVGAGYVTLTLVAVPVIGAAPTIALTVAGQQLASAAVDHAGLLRLPRRAVTRRRWAGVAVLVAGSALVQLG